MNVKKARELVKKNRKDYVKNTISELEQGIEYAASDLEYATDHTLLTEYADDVAKHFDKQGFDVAVYRENNYQSRIRLLWN